jgi:hypothetical protein
LEEQLKQQQELRQALEKV